MGSAGVLLVLLVGALARIPESEGGKETPASKRRDPPPAGERTAGKVPRHPRRSLLGLRRRRPESISPPPEKPPGHGGAHFLMQVKSECCFLNRTQRVRYLSRYFYDQQEILRFDSDCGEFGAVAKLGEAEADRWNRDEQLLQYQKTGGDRCRYNYGGLQGGPVLGRRVKPTVTIVPTKMDPASPATICSARGFYPMEIEVQWLKNGQLEEEGVAFGEELQNGDWTYQLQVMLETQPQRGDVYTCKVEHASLEVPITVKWEPRSSNSARSKLWTGIMGAVLGMAFFSVGLSHYLKSSHAIPIQPPAALMN